MSKSFSYINSSSMDECHIRSGSFLKIARNTTCNKVKSGFEKLLLKYTDRVKVYTDFLKSRSTGCA